MGKSHFDAAKHADNGSADLLCLGAVDERIEHRRYKKVDIGHEDMYVARDMLPKAMHCGDPNHWHIKGKYSQDMGHTCVESFEALLVGSNGQDRAQNEHIGEEDGKQVHAKGGYKNKESVDAVDSDVSTGQLHHVWVQAVGMGKNIGPADRQPHDEKGKREEGNEAPSSYSYTHSNNDSIGEHSGIMQRITNGHIAVKAHGQKNS